MRAKRDIMEVYPNPFSGQSTVFLSLQSPSNVEMTIVSSVGQVVATKEFGMISGKANLDFDASDLNKGVYFYSIKS